MSTSFDPYYQWLAIPPSEQPPHLYRLLGLRPFEDNLDVIETAADQKMLHVRTYQSGKHAALSQKLLNQIAAAKVTLLDTAKKTAYDAELRAKLIAAEQANSKIGQAQRPSPSASSLAKAKPAARPSATPATPQMQLRRPAPVRRQNNSLVPLAVGGGIVFLLVVAGIGAGLVMLGGEEPIAARPAITTNNVTSDVSDDVPDKVELPSPVATVNNRPPTLPTLKPSVSDPPPAVDKLPETEFDTDEPVGDPPAVPDKFGADLDGDLPQATQKLAVPDKATREAKQTQILQIFPVAKARTFEEKGELAAQLIRTAGESKHDPPALFALLNLAREQAAEAGQIRLAFEAIDLLGETFDIDADAVRLASLQQASRAAAPPAAKRDLIVAGLEVIEQLAAADKFDDADELSDRLLTVARPLRDNELTRVIVERRAALGQSSAQFKQAQAALATLQQSPDDPAANLVAGRYLAFVKQDWDTGVAHLAKGSDTALAAAAQAELAAPETPAGQEKLADAWWEAAAVQKDASSQDICRARAALWYGEIVGELNGLAKVSVEKRIAEAANLDVAMVSGARPGNVALEWKATYLDDLPEAEVRMGAHPLFKHGLGYSKDVQPRLFQGQQQSHSLSLHTKANDFVAVSYLLDGSFDKLEALAALWDPQAGSKNAAGSPLVFTVICDGNVAWKSAPLRAHGSSEPCSVEVKGVKLLTLRIDCPGNNECGWSVWIEPRLLRKAKAYSPALNPLAAAAFPKRPRRSAG